MKSEAVEAFSRKVRKKIHIFFYDVGYKIQKHLFAVAIGSILMLTLCVVVPYSRNGITVQTDVEDMWIASTGRLHDELKHSEKMTNRNGFQGVEEFGYEVLMQVSTEENQNLLTAEMLNEHLHMVEKIKNMKSKTFDVEWTLRDICDRYKPPSFGVSSDWNQAIDNMVPCHIMTPLDCFWEGSIIASYGSHYKKHLYLDEEELVNDTLKEGYMYHDPQDLVKYLKEGKTKEDHFMYKEVKRFVDKVGIGHGYMKRPCFSDEQCPKSKNMTDKIAEQFEDGCKGVATNYMHWPKDLIVSKTFINSSGYVSANALQTVFKIQSPRNFVLSADLSRKFAAREFQEQEAAQVINDWKVMFTEMVDKENKRKEFKSEMLAFSTTSFKNMVKGFSKVETRDGTIIGLILLTVYTVFTLKRWSSSIYSYGLVGFVGVVCSVAAVLAGLGLGNLAGMKLTAISIQVLPFLALGLGLDNIFLLARTYIFVCDRREFKCKEIIGMCLSEVGLDITLASFTNACAFLMASMVPLGAVQTFARQAAIIYGVNWYTVIFLFSSLLAVDVKRQKKKHFDLLFCMKDCSYDDDEDTQNNNNDYPDVIQSNLSMILPGATPDMPPISAHGHVTINSPSTLNTTFGGEGLKDENQIPVGQTFGFNRSKAAQRSGHRSFNVTRKDREERKQRQKKKEQGKELCKESACKNFIFKVSLTYFAQRYYGAWLVKTPVKASVLLLCAIQLIVATVGTMRVEKGLELAEMLPSNTTQHKYMEERQRHFSYYKVYVNTRNNPDGTLFDYSKNQELLYEFYERLKKVDNVLTTPNKFWLPVYRDWLKECHDLLQKEWNVTMNLQCAPNCPEAPDEVRRIYQLLSTSLPGTKQNDMDCSLPKQYRGSDYIVNRELVNEKGIITPELFYLGLSLWYNDDSLGLWESEVEILPMPEHLVVNQGCAVFPVQLKAAPEYITMSFQVHNLQTSNDYVKLIKDIRAVCDEFKHRGLNSYPTGIPFTYWEQFVSLDKHIAIGVSVVLLSTFIISLICLMNIKAALFIVSFLGIILFEACGFLGLFQIKLSAISIIPLMMSMGTGTQFVVHSVIAFVNTPGDRNKRMRGSLEIMFASVFDCCLSSIIMISLLASSKYEFIVKYFFQLMLWIVLVAMVNTLLILPVVLSFCGPCLEKRPGHNAIAPVQHPTYYLNFPGTMTEWQNCNRRNTLSTIPEETSCLNGGYSSRPGTPAYKSGSYASSTHGRGSTQNSAMTLRDYDDEEDDYLETSLDQNEYSNNNTRRAPTPAAWMHNPNVCHSTGQANQRVCKQLPQTNYRNLPNKNNSGRSSSSRHNSSQMSNRSCGEQPIRTGSGLMKNNRGGGDHPRDRPNFGGNQRGTPTFIEMQDKNRVTTKVKATFAMEVEYSHPCSVNY